MSASPLTAAISTGFDKRYKESCDLGTVFFWDHLHTKRLLQCSEERHMRRIATTILVNDCFGNDQFRESSIPPRAALIQRTSFHFAAARLYQS